MISACSPGQSNSRKSIMPQLCGTNQEANPDGSASWLLVFTHKTRPDHSDCLPPYTLLTIIPVGLIHTQEEIADTSMENGSVLR